MRRNAMAWNKPTIVEIPVSMEINMYACAKRK
jgi:coenzyme PQQ precursor peptide PqqA